MINVKKMANTENSRFDELISNLQSVVEQIKGNIFDCFVAELASYSVVRPDVWAIIAVSVSVDFQSRLFA